MKSHDYQTLTKHNIMTNPRSNYIKGINEDTFLAFDIYELLDNIAVEETNMFTAGDHPINMYAVISTNGILAYFANELDAYRFRLDYINRLLNP